MFIYTDYNCQDTFFLSSISTIYKYNNTTQAFQFTPNYHNPYYSPQPGEGGISSEGFFFQASCSVDFPYTYGYGIYKFTSTINDFYFFIDFRDNRYMLNPLLGINADLTIRYNPTDHNFYIGYEKSNGIITDLSLMAPITKGQIIRISNLLNDETLQTGLFPNYWKNCLSVFLTATKHPLLIWGPNQTYNTNSPINYQIYKSIGDSNHFALVSTVNNTIFEYEDLSLKLGGSDINKEVFYKVKAIFNNNFTEDTYAFDAGIMMMQQSPVISEKKI